MSKPNSIADLVQLALRAELAGIWTGMPARVVRYSADKQRADVQPLIKVGYLDEAEERQVQSLPVVCAVPVVFPGAGRYRITFPISAGPDGTVGWLMFSSVSLDKWLVNGGEVDPEDDRRQHLSDAAFLPGLRDFGHPLKSAPTDRATFGDDEGLQIHIDGSKVMIGSSNPAELEKSVIGDTAQSFLNSFNTWAATHVHPDPLAGTTGQPVAPPPTVPTITSTSVLVKK